MGEEARRQATRLRSVGASGSRLSHRDAQQVAACVHELRLRSPEYMVMRPVIHPLSSACRECGRLSTILVRNPSSTPSRRFSRNCLVFSAEIVLLDSRKGARFSKGPAQRTKSCGRMILRIQDRVADPVMSSCAMNSEFVQLSFISQE